MRFVCRTGHICHKKRGKGGATRGQLLVYILHSYAEVNVLELPHCDLRLRLGYAYTGLQVVPCTEGLIR